MRVHRTNEDYLSDMVFANAYGKEYMYTPDGMVDRPGVASNPQPSIPRPGIPNGKVGMMGEVKADIPTAYAISTVAKADVGRSRKPVSRSARNAAEVAQSRLAQYVNKVRTGR